MSGARPRHNWPLLLAVLLGIGLLAALSPGILPAAVLLGLFLPVLVVPRIGVDRIGEVIVMLFSGVGAYVIVMVLGEPDAYLSARGIGPLGAAFGLFFLLIAITRLHQKSSYGGDPATAAAVFMAVLSMGGISTGYLYPVSATTVLILLVAALRFGDAARPSLFRINRKGQGTLLVILGVWAALFFGFITALPLAYNYAFSIFRDAYITPNTGFGFSMTLGDLEGLFQSETVVMRIAGPKPDHLRGAVYTRYVNGRWLSEKGDFRTVRVGDIADESGDDVTSVSIVGGERNRYFAPLGRARLAVKGGRVEISPSGVLDPVNDAPATAIAFFLDPPRIAAGSAPPSEEYLAVPDGLRPSLMRILSALGLSEMAPSKLLASLSSRLQRDYTYALDVKIPPGADPLVGFLTQTKRGHCEYFASAMAMLARTAGIPTRVVGGYRVHERNPIGDYYVVREKNAHAWVEAYIEGVGWRTFDPTPPLEVFARYDDETPFFAAAVDAAAATATRIAGAMADLGPWQMSGVIVGLLLLWMVVRVARRLKAARRRDRIVSPRSYSAPPSAIAELLRVLEARGVGRRSSEPLETYAARLAAAPGAEETGLSRARDLIRDYAAWRFGHKGSEGSLVGALEKWFVDFN